jgi:Fic-DOC domain mobile mystery protein B
MTGATPLDPDEAAGLVPTHIATREQLDEWEAENIHEGERWAASLRRRDLFDDAFLRKLHQRMFGRTWRWAGAYRRTEKNIGLAPERIAVEVRQLLGDLRAQIASAVEPIDRIAARFHHRLVSIHPFANGNGRHARLMTDLVLEAQGAERFSWGEGDLVHPSTARAQYIAALRAADSGDYEPLFGFVRSGRTR